MAREQTDVLRGTLDLLILRTLAGGALHGWALSQSIQRQSENLLRVGQGSLYPALYRLEHQGLIAAEWGESDNRRKAKFYSVTVSGRRRLKDEVASWNRLADAIAAALGTKPDEV